MRVRVQIRLWVELEMGGKRGTPDKTRDIRQTRGINGDIGHHPFLKVTLQKRPRVGAYLGRGGVGV